MLGQMDELGKHLSALGCPVKVGSQSALVGELRLSVLEWLCRVYDTELADQCARESSSRTARLGKQLFVLGLGGTKLAQCEQFAAAGTGANVEESLNVANELVQLIFMSREMPTEDAVRARFEKKKKEKKRFI